MENINDGGPAFPHSGMSQIGGQPIQQVFAGGMSLRDWFAGQALASRTNKLEHGIVYTSDLVKECYYIADAMLEARNRK